MPFRFRSILISLNAIHCFQLHGNGIRFRLHGMEGNKNVTVFMAPTVGVYKRAVEVAESIEVTIHYVLSLNVLT